MQKKIKQFYYDKIWFHFCKGCDIHIISTFLLLLLKKLEAVSSMCDPLCENPAKVFFCDLLFYTQNHPSYSKEHSVKNLPLYL